MKYILGTKEKMTQIFDDEGVVHPVTAIQSGPATVTQIKNLETDGYDAVQVGFGERKEKNIAKAQLGHFGDNGLFAHVKEARVSEDVASTLKVGDKVEVSTFEEGDVVRVTAISKGKGFQGVVKRWNFAGGPRTHGQKHTERSGGSIGSQGVARVFKGMKMPGRTGTDRVTVKSLKIVKVDTDNNLIYIEGAVPGRRGSLVEIQA